MNWRQTRKRWARRPTRCAATARNWLKMLSVTTLEGHSAHGLSDLARAFLFAGSRSLLASHWSVDSKDGKNSSAMPGGSHYSHSLYWAPFMVIGDGAAMSP